MGVFRESKGVAHQSLRENWISMRHKGAPDARVLCDLGMLHIVNCIPNQNGNSVTQW